MLAGSCRRSQKVRPCTGSGGHITFHQEGLSTGVMVEKICTEISVKRGPGKILGVLIEVRDEERRGKKVSILECLS